MDYLDAENFAVLDSDIDISMRIHRSKWKLLFTKEIIISHKGGNSYKINHKRVLLFYRSRWALLRKNGMVMLPKLAKLAFKLRLMGEQVVFKLLAKKNADKYADKITGREILLKELHTYK